MNTAASPRPFAGCPGVGTPLGASPSCKAGLRGAWSRDVVAKDPQFPVAVPGRLASSEDPGRSGVTGGYRRMRWPRARDRQPLREGPYGQIPARGWGGQVLTLIKDCTNVSS